MIFDSKERTDDSYKKPNETTYGFLDRTSTDRYGIVRNDVNRMLSLYPEGQSKNKLISNLTRGNFEEAFFELFLYDFLIAKKFETIPEPEMEGLTPDFLIKKSSESFLVEATTLNNPEWMSKSSNRRDAFIEHINHNVSSDHFYLSVNFIDESVCSNQLTECSLKFSRIIKISFDAYFRNKFSSKIIFNDLSRLTEKSPLAFA
jgi:hypothetical protein